MMEHGILVAKERFFQAFCKPYSKGSNPALLTWESMLVPPWPCFSNWSTQESYGDCVINEGFGTFPTNSGTQHFLFCNKYQGIPMWGPVDHSLRNTEL